MFFLKKLIFFLASLILGCLAALGAVFVYNTFLHPQPQQIIVKTITIEKIVQVPQHSSVQSFNDTSPAIAISLPPSDPKITTGLDNTNLNSNSNFTTESDTTNQSLENNSRALPNSASLQEKNHKNSLNTKTTCTNQTSSDNMSYDPISGNVFYNGILTFSNVIKKVSSSIVNIYTQTTKDNNIINTYGSGIIMTKEGYILTNYHVIAGAKEITITTNGNQVYAATLVGSDQLTDLAVLQVDSHNTDKLPPIGISEITHHTQVGDVVLAIGNPLNLGQSVSMGIVSALGRASVDKVGYQQLIQTNLSLNTGNSGGALINTNGQVVGINTLIIQKAYGNQVNGLGFAIPIDTAISIMKQIIIRGYAEHAYFGADVAVTLNSSKHNIAVINTVIPNSPAYKAGFKVGDQILCINGRPIVDAYSALSLINSFEPKTKLTIMVDRNGEHKTLKVILGSINNN